MATKQRVNDLRDALISALGMKFSEEELGVLAGRLRFDSTPALSQQDVADGIGYSQPHISNVERNLLRRFKTQAEQHQKATNSNGNKRIHELVDDLKGTVAELETAAGPRPFTLTFKKVRPTAK